MVAASVAIGPPVASTTPPENAAQVPPVSVPAEAFWFVTAAAMTTEPPLDARAQGAVRRHQHGQRRALIGAHGAAVDQAEAVGVAELARALDRVVQVG